MERMEFAAMLAAVRERAPLVQCITNIVTVNDCANILLAAGASATMAHHPLEVGLRKSPGLRRRSRTA